MERSVWRKRLGPGYFRRLVDFNTGEVRPGRLLVQEGDFGYAVMGLGREAAAILRWLGRPGRGEELDQTALVHSDVPDWVRKLDEPELRRIATLEAQACPELGRYNHNHWPPGSPGGQGGEFAPRGFGSDEPSLSELVQAGDGKPRLPGMPELTPELFPVPGYRKKSSNLPNKRGHGTI